MAKHQDGTGGGVNSKTRGQQLKTKGWKVACNQMRGDWEFYSEGLGLNRWDNEPEKCWLCGASNSNHACLWTDGSRTSGWRPTCKTHETWLAELAAAGLDLPGVFKILTMRL